MIEADKSDTIQLINQYRVESSSYYRQFTLWLGIGCASAAVAEISLATNLPDPDYAFRILLPSLWILLAGVIFSGASLPVSALKAKSTGEHFSEAFNREQFQSAARSMPQHISVPARMTEHLNAPRDDIIRRGNLAHERAEAAWKRRIIWHSLLLICLTASALCFISGVAWPLLYITLGGSWDPM